MDKEDLRCLLNVLKYQVQQAFEQLAEDRGEELGGYDAEAMIGIMGAMSNVQACLEAGLDRDEVFGAVGQCQAWDEAFANRGAPAADAMFGRRAFQEV